MLLSCFFRTNRIKRKDGYGTGQYQHESLLTAEPRGSRRDDRQRPRGSGDSSRGRYRGQVKRPFSGSGFIPGKRRYY